MIIADIPQATVVYVPGQTVFTGASFWESNGTSLTRCVWSGELSSEESLKELTRGWTPLERAWVPALVVVSDHRTGNTAHVSIEQLLS